MALGATMYQYSPALLESLLIIKTFEGFSEKAYADPDTHGAPFTIGYGTQFYPDGSPVKQGQYVTKIKALEYLKHEVELIARQLEELNLGLDESQTAALISFAHSVGWDTFLYSNIIDSLEEEDYNETVQDMSCWIFDNDHKVVGGLIDRSRHEIKLFLREQDELHSTSKDILLKAFREYNGSRGQVEAIRQLQDAINPYALSVFANEYNNHTELVEFSDKELQTIYQDWK
jgi:lysozyme